MARSLIHLSGVCSAVSSFVAIAGLLCACGNYGMERVEMRTSEASTDGNNVKILFVVDRSNSMEITDPNNRTLDAIAEVVATFVDDSTTQALRPGVRFALMGFSSQATAYTPYRPGPTGGSDCNTGVAGPECQCGICGTPQEISAAHSIFAADGPGMIGALSQLAAAGTGPNTDFTKALYSIHGAVELDMILYGDQAQYEIVFVSDGLPSNDYCRGDANYPPVVLATSELLSDLGLLYDARVRLHTAWVADPNLLSMPGSDMDLCGNSAEFSLAGEIRTLLGGMAAAGKGSFSAFTPADQVDFSGLDFLQ